MSNTFLTVFIQ